VGKRGRWGNRRGNLTVGQLRHLRESVVGKQGGVPVMGRSTSITHVPGTSVNWWRSRRD
jgi:hypothetical protein